MTPDQALRRAYTDAARLSAFLIRSLGRKPGEAMDDTDVRLYQQELFPLIDAVRTGRLSAVFEASSEGSDSPAVSCSPELWQVIHFIRGAEFRPGFEAVGKRVREVLGLPLEAVPGGDAAARRIIRVPLSLPWGPASTEPPIDPEAPWIKRFACELARGDEDFDAALLTLLTRLPTDSARDRAMTELASARRANAALKENRTQGAQRSRQAHKAGKTGLQAALETIAAYRSSSNNKSNNSEETTR